jgi:hypothetical protein
MIKKWYIDLNKKKRILVATRRHCHTIAICVLTSLNAFKPAPSTLLRGIIWCQILELNGGPFDPSALRPFGSAQDAQDAQDARDKKLLFNLTPRSGYEAVNFLLVGYPLRLLKDVGVFRLGCDMDFKEMPIR